MHASILIYIYQHYCYDSHKNTSWRWINGLGWMVSQMQFSKMHINSNWIENMCTSSSHNYDEQHDWMRGNAPSLSLFSVFLSSILCSLSKLHSAENEMWLFFHTYMLSFLSLSHQLSENEMWLMRWFMVFHTQTPISSSAPLDHNVINICWLARKRNETQKICF